MTKEEEEIEIWAIACKHGIDKIQARAIWEREQQQKKQIEEARKLREQQNEPSTQEEEVQETEEEEDIEESVDREMVQERKLRILDKFEKEVDALNKDYSNIPFEHLPLEIQTALRERQKAINEELIRAQTKANEEAQARINKYAEETQKKIDEKLLEAMKTINVFFTDKDVFYVKDFVSILAVMQKDPANNQEWIIRLFNTKDGIDMLTGNHTKPKSEK
jgi:CRISPR/Cas system CSM-associated protein Csm5 (group 7 of RAMP superfamily)